MSNPSVGPEGYARTLADLYDQLDDGLFDYGYPFFQELRGDLDYYLYNNWWGYEPWLATVDRSINDGFYYHLYDQNSYQPWLQTIHYDLQNYLYDWGTYRPWLETLREEISLLRWLIENVYDYSNYALRTVSV